jgi:hypothetical protein
MLADEYLRLQMLSDEPVMVTVYAEGYIDE